MNAASNRNVLQYPTEREAYAAAANEPDPGIRAAMLEAFILKYADSAMLVNAFDLALRTYEKLDREHSADTTPLLANSDEDNVPLLAILVSRGRIQISTIGPESVVFSKTCARAHRGIQELSTWQKPHNLSDEQYHRLLNNVSGIFYGMAGFCASLEKNYEEARSYYLKSLEFDPNNIANLSALGFADLQISPIDVDGFWYSARSMALGYAKYGGSYDTYPYAEIRYKDYHGSLEGWDKIKEQAARQAAPPPGFTVERAKQHN